MRFEGAESVALFGFNDRKDRLEPFFAKLKNHTEEWQRDMMKRYSSERYREEGRLPRLIVDTP